MDKTNDSVLKALKSLSQFSFSSTLMQYYKDLVDETSAVNLLKNYEVKLNFFGAAPIPLKQTIKDMQIFSMCLNANFDLIELSPVMPLGANSIITKISQNTVSSTIRSGEVIADPTTALILEGAFRRKKKKGYKEINLATMCRVLRIQKFDNPNYYPHFNSFAMASLVYSSLEKKFTYKKFIEHISTYLDYMIIQNKNSFTFDDIEVRISSIRLLNDILSTENAFQDGAIILFDDYNFNRANPNMGVRKAIRDTFGKNERYELSFFTSYGWHGRAFFVHDREFKL